MVSLALMPSVCMLVQRNSRVLPSALHRPLILPPPGVVALKLFVAKFRLYIFSCDDHLLMPPSSMYGWTKPLGCVNVVRFQSLPMKISLTSSLLLQADNVMNVNTKIIVLVVFAILFVVAIFVVYDAIFSSNRKYMGDDNSLPHGEMYDSYHEVITSCVQEVLKQPYEEIAILSHDGLVLSGKYYHYQINMN